jgi:hypothetical protein|tara:strand:+ start:3856 stop:4782 length:927 start_codon:yes stop_codon:yes gene_type:complete
MEHFGRNFKIMKITKIKLKSLIEANLAIYGEDRVVGRFLKDTFRKLGGQKKENWKNTRFIYWLHAKPIESILKGTIPGEIGVRAYHKDQVVNSPKWGAPFGLEVEGRVTLASIIDIFSGTSMPHLIGSHPSNLPDDMEIKPHFGINNLDFFKTKSGLKSFRKYPNYDYAFDPPEGQLDMGVLEDLFENLPDDEREQYAFLQSRIANKSREEVEKMLQDASIILHDNVTTKSGKSIVKTSMALSHGNEFLIANAVPVAIWIKEGDSFPPSLQDAIRNSNLEVKTISSGESKIVERLELRKVICEILKSL